MCEVLFCVVNNPDTNPYSFNNIRFPQSIILTVAVSGFDCMGIFSICEQKMMEIILEFQKYFPRKAFPYISISTHILSLVDKYLC